MPTQISTDNLAWLQTHREAIQGAAHNFLRGVIRSGGPIQRSNVDDIPPPKVPLPWGDADQQREVVIGFILAFQSCGRHLSVAQLVRVLQIMTDFAAGVGVLSVLENLKKAGVVLVAKDPSPQPQCQGTLFEHHVSIEGGAFDTVTGFILPPRDEAAAGKSARLNPASRSSTPLLLFELGTELQVVARAHSRFANGVSERADGAHRRTWIEKASKTLVVTLNQLESIKGRLSGYQIDETDAKILALLFAKQCMGILSDIEDLTNMVGSQLNGRLEIVRRLRKGPLIQAGIIASLRSSHLVVDEELVGILLDLDEEDTQVKPAAITIFENRIKGTAEQPTKDKGDDRDPGDEFVPFGNN